MDDRRSFQRTGFHLRTEIGLDDEDRSIGLLRSNISFGGIGGYTRDLVSKDAAVTVRIYFSQRDGGEKQESVQGRIAWCKNDGNFVALGVHFNTLNAKQHPLLISYLQYADQFE